MEQKWSISEGELKAISSLDAFFKFRSLMHSNLSEEDVKQIEQKITQIQDEFKNSEVVSTALLLFRSIDDHQ